MYTLIHIKSLFRGYKIYVDDTLVAVAEETQQGFQSITFRGVQEARRFITFRGDPRNETNGEMVGKWMDDFLEHVTNMLCQLGNLMGTLLWC